MLCILVQNALRFDAKCGAFWCKMQSKMVQNAMQFAPKRNAFCRKSQSILLQIAVRFAAKRKAKCNNMYNEMQQNTASIGTLGIYFDSMTCRIRAKYTSNCGFLGAKCRCLELKKTRTGNHLERQNGAKCTPRS